MVCERKDEELINDFYNNSQNLDSDFRRTTSRIKGLRAFNNWIKCALIQKFASSRKLNTARNRSGQIYSEVPDSRGLRVIEIGCGKGDLHKWHKAAERAEIYVGLDPARVSIRQAQERWEGYQKTQKYGAALSRAEFYTQDCFGESIKSIPVIDEIGFNCGGGAEGGFDIASMMFCMQYAFENETKVRIMLANITGALKVRGKLIGCVPNSHVIGERIRDLHKGNGVGEMRETEKASSWGNSIYNVRFLGQTPADGIFHLSFGNRYLFTLAEAVEAPEYVVPREEFCSLAQEYSLELHYCKPFDEIWAEEREGGVLARLSKEMGIQDDSEALLVSPEEMEVANFYRAFVFLRV